VGTVDVQGSGIVGRGIDLEGGGTAGRGRERARADNSGALHIDRSHRGGTSAGEEQLGPAQQRERGGAGQRVVRGEKQIAAAEIRLAIATRDLENHDLQIENAKQVDEFMRGKFTNRDLYDWMVSQISGIYFQSYQMAYDVAKRAERTYRFELGLEDSSFVQFGYWNSLKKGLLAGERLYHDIKRMEVAYLDQNKREYEITKHISLVMNNPLALIALRETGKCEIELPELLLDMDYPGHYLRRIRTISLTIPCVVGPYTSINCTLTLLNSRLRNGRSQ